MNEMKKILKSCNFSRLAKIFSFIAAFFLFFLSSAQLYDQEAGDHFLFGRYPMDISGGVKPIEWIVLQKNKDGSLYLLSLYGLEGRRFDDSENNWKKSELRKWLKKEFKNKAFNKFEQKGIVKGEISILTIGEAKMVFPDAGSRRLYVTPYAQKQNVPECVSCGGSSWWWLRNPGDTEHTVAYIDASGNIDAGGMPVHVDNLAVRPIIQLNLKKLERLSKNSYSVISMSGAASLQEQKNGNHKLSQPEKERKNQDIKKEKQKKAESEKNKPSSVKESKKDKSAKK